MAFLLDTMCFLWLIREPKKVSATARDVFLETEEKIYLSYASIWEIVIKYSIGKLALAEPPEVFVPSTCRQHGIDILPFSAETFYRIRFLPHYHNDTFDRLLVAEALTQGLTILTSDPMIRRYPVPTLW